MNWGILALTAALTWTGAVYAQEYNEPSFLRYIYRFDKDGKIFQNGIFSTPVPRFEDLKRAAPKSYEEFLDHLFTAAPSLKKHHILLHHSQSLQLASLEHPRVLMFDGGVVFAVSEHPENNGQRVEMMEVDPATREINMREITFSGGAVKFDANPKACASCHGSPAKPLWDPYDFWPNTFASAAGTFRSRQEKEAYARLLSAKASSPLLSRLELNPNLSLSEEEVNGLTFFVTQIGYTRFWNQAIPVNDQLTGAKPALLATFNHCFREGTFEDQKSELLKFFPPGSLSSEEIERLDRIYTDVVQSRSFTKKFQDGLYLDYFASPEYIFTLDHNRLIDEQNSLTFIRWLLDLEGISGANMSLSLLANDYLLTSPSNFELDMMSTLYEIRPSLFAGLKIETSDLAIGRNGWILLDCEQLKKKSLASSRVAATSKWRSYLQPKSERPVVSRCAKCHTEFYGEAPKIEFDDSLNLARRLRTSDLGDRILSRITTSGRGQMPPDAPLTPEEIASIREFIQGLRGH